MKLAKIYLIGFGLFTLAFGLAYLIAPAAMTKPAGFDDLSASATTDVRATYGGFQVGIGLFLLYAAKAAERHRPGLWLVVLSIGSVLASRILGVVLDGDLNEFHSSGLAVEFVLTASAIFVLRRVTNESRLSDV